MTLAFGLLLCLSSLAGCGPALSGEPAQARSGGPGRHEIVVFAAASLSEPFTQIAKAFEAQHPNAYVTYSFGGSALLRTQIEQGAPADVFASADLANAQRARAEALIAPEVIFARNRLVVVVPADNPGRVESLADLARPGLKVALAAPDVPAGAYAAELLRRASGVPGYGLDFAARVDANVVSREPNVKQALARVRLGEVDAGIVYATDASPDTQAGRWSIRAVEIPDDLNADAAYAIASTSRSRNQELAREFVAFVISPAGQAILRRAGFAAP